ncbi:UNVERIFIED_CONTAM: hypothetical protein FKN15_074726 [Acipenser sinensis]
MNVAEWELLNIDAQTTTWQIQREDWSKVIFKLRMKRRPLLYLVNLVIPSAFLMVIDLISFYLPVHQIDRGAFKMTLLLGYTVFLLIMNDLLPNNAGGTPIIESDPSEESKLVSSPGAQSSQLIQNLLTSLSRDILVIRSQLDYRSLHEHKQGEWIRIAFIWEAFLLRLYLLLLVVFSIILISSWCMWYRTWTQGLTGVLLQKPFMDSSMVRDTGSSSVSGEEKVASDLTAKLLLLDKLVSLENDVMETKRKRSFPGFGTPLDRLSLSTMEMKGKQRPPACPSPQYSPCSGCSQSCHLFQFMDSSMVRDTGSSSVSGEEKVASDLTAKLLLLDKLVSLENDVMETLVQ